MYHYTVIVSVEHPSDSHLYFHEEYISNHESTEFFSTVSGIEIHDVNVRKIDSVEEYNILKKYLCFLEDDKLDINGYE